MYPKRPDLMQLIPYAKELTVAKLSSIRRSDHDRQLRHSKIILPTVLGKERKRKKEREREGQQIMTACLEKGTNHVGAHLLPNTMRGKR